VIWDSSLLGVLFDTQVPARTIPGNVGELHWTTSQRHVPEGSNFF
jgi:hypothetical protein